MVKFIDVLLYSENVLIFKGAVASESNQVFALCEKWNFSPTPRKPRMNPALLFDMDNVTISPAYPIELFGNRTQIVRFSSIGFWFEFVGLITPSHVRLQDNVQPQQGINKNKGAVKSQRALFIGIGQGNDKFKIIIIIKKGTKDGD